MIKKFDETEGLVYSGRIKVPYSWAAGRKGSRFLKGLRDDGQILGTFCPTCRQVFVPPRRTCGRCFTSTLEWREVGPEGTLTTYTLPGRRENIHPVSDPFAFGLIKLDGADTALAHVVTGFKPDQLRIGLRVKAVFARNPQGHILDIESFKPID